MLKLHVQALLAMSPEGPGGEAEGRAGRKWYFEQLEIRVRGPACHPACPACNPAVNSHSRPWVTPVLSEALTLLMRSSNFGALIQSGVFLGRAYPQRHHC